MLSYWFWPNPGGASYGSPKVIALLGICLLMVASSFAVAQWREAQGNAVTKRLSKSWPGALRWFGFLGTVLLVSRIEQIQFLAMRALWLVWGLALLAYVLFQVWWFRRRHYTVVSRGKAQDPRAMYLPGKG